MTAPPPPTPAAPGLKTPALVPDGHSEPELIAPPSALPAPPPPGDPNLSSARIRGSGTVQTAATRPLPMSSRPARPAASSPSASEGVKPAGYRFDDPAGGLIEPASATATKPKSQ
jgi:hypothetical protein